MATTVKIDVSSMLPDGRPFIGFFRSKLSRNAIIDHSFVGSYEWQEVEIDDGRCDVFLIPNELLGEDTYYDYQIVARSGYGEKVTQQGVIIVPNAECNLADIISVPSPQEEQASSAMNAARAINAANSAIAASEAAVNAYNSAKGDADTVRNFYEAIGPHLESIDEVASNIDEIKETVELGEQYITEMGVMKARAEEAAEYAQKVVIDAEISHVDTITDEGLVTIPTMADMTAALADKASKTELNTAVSDKATKTELSTAVAGMATQSWVQTYINGLDAEGRSF